VPRRGNSFHKEEDKHRGTLSRACLHPPLI
jgi:hypothetical protein